MTGADHVFITPPLDGPPTGGTLYNAHLIAALAAAGASVLRLGLEEGRRALSSGRPGAFLVDSLFLDDFAALAGAAGPARSVGLLMHYLPSLVARGDAWTPRDLTAVEQRALRAAGTVVAPSLWLADVLANAGVPKAATRVVEPGTGAPLPSTRTALSPDARPLAALLVGNVVPGKGVAPFLAALASEVGCARPSLVFVVVGSLECDPEYAAECRALARACPALDGAIVFASALPHAEVLRALAQSHVLVSASRMESYGMALAEARAVGVPILARRGGNAGAHAHPASGGELFDDDRALAARLVQLSHDVPERVRRLALALAGVKRRTWADAAEDFLRAYRPLRWRRSPWSSG